MSKLNSAVFSTFLVPLLVVSPLWSQTPQIAVQSASAEAATPDALKIQILESDGNQVTAGSRTLKGFEVQVRDGAGTPVPDAAVAFRLPDTEPTGTFADGTHSMVAYTDQSGRATANGIQWGSTPGAFNVRITATKGTSHAGTLIDETVVAGTAPALHPVAADQQPSARPVPGTLARVDRPSVQVTRSGEAASEAVPHVTTAAAAPPSVSVTHDSSGAAPHSNKSKWIIALVVIAAAAGAGIAVAGKGKSSSTPSNSTVTIGAPSISVGP